MEVVWHERRRATPKEAILKTRSAALVLLATTFLECAAIKDFDQSIYKCFCASGSTIFQPVPAGFPYLNPVFRLFSSISRRCRRFVFPFFQRVPPFFLRVAVEIFSTQRFSSPSQPSVSCFCFGGVRACAAARCPLKC